MGRVKGKVRARFTRGLHRIIFKEERITRMDENTFLYVTKFINKADSPWRVLEKGRELLVIAPGKDDSIESWHSRTDWSRWSKVVREKDERLTLTENPAWVCPWQDHHLLELINEAGAPEESVHVLTPNPAVTGPSDYAVAVRGVPMILPLDVQDPLVKFSKIIWRKKKVRRPVAGTKYFITEWQTVKEMVPRAKNELKAILKERQRIEQERLDKASRKAMEAQEKLLLGEQHD